MRGTLSIVQARRMNTQLSNVWVFLTECPQPDIYTLLNDPDMCLLNGFMPEVHIYSTDNLRTLDLRCLTGLIVHLVGVDPTKLAAAAKQINRFKPHSIYACNGRELIEHHTEIEND